MEHLNRECKHALSGLGSNITDSSVLRIGKCIGKTNSILHCFDQLNNISEQSDRHSHHSMKKDIEKILQLLKSSKVFDKQQGRYHRHFRDFKSNELCTISLPDLHHWMSEQFQKLIMYH